MPDRARLYRGCRFPAKVIAHAVRLYLRFALSLRDVEELMAERGVVVSAGALFWLALLTVDSTYTVHILGPLMLMGLGMGTALSTSINTATVGVDPANAEVASATVNAVQQVGGSVGTALAPAANACQTTPDDNG